MSTIASFFFSSKKIRNDKQQTESNIIIFSPLSSSRSLFFVIWWSNYLWAYCYHFIIVSHNLCFFEWKCGIKISRGKRRISYSRDSLDSERIPGIFMGFPLYKTSRSNWFICKLIYFLWNTDTFLMRSIFSFNHPIPECGHFSSSILYETEDD